MRDLAVELSNSFKKMGYGLVFLALALLPVALAHMGAVFIASTWLSGWVLSFFTVQYGSVPLLIAAAVLTGLVLYAFRPNYVELLKFTYDSTRDGEVALTPERPIVHGRLGWGLPADMNPLGTSSMRLVTKILSLLLLFGPSLLLTAARAIKEGAAVLRADTRRILLLLHAVHRLGGRASFEEIRQAVPDFSPQKDLAALSRVDGVIMLSRDFQGIALADRLLKKLERSE